MAGAGSGTEALFAASSTGRAGGGGEGVVMGGGAGCGLATTGSGTATTGAGTGTGAGGGVGGTFAGATGSAGNGRSVALGSLASVSVAGGALVFLLGPMMIMLFVLGTRLGAARAAATKLAAYPGKYGNLTMGTISWQPFQHPALLFCWVTRSCCSSIHRVSTAGDFYLCKLQVLQGDNMWIC